MAVMAGSMYIVTAIVCLNGVTATTSDTTGTITTADNCGQAPLNNVIVGGEGAPSGKWPWQVSIHEYISGLLLCGGTLINNQWVLTAAHCLDRRDPILYHVYLGRQTQSITVNPNGVKRFVQSIITHPEYNNDQFANDIALMKLSEPVTFTEYIRPVCLPSEMSTFHHATTCWATGWGNRGYNEPLPSPQTLQEVEVQVVGNEECASNTEMTHVIKPSMICAGGKKGKAVCHEDYGGPLQCKQSSVWVQAGVTHFMVSCGTGTAPDVYARVSAFQTWIKQNVGDGPGLGFVKFPSNDIANATTASGNTVTCSVCLHLLSFCLLSLV